MAKRSGSGSKRKGGRGAPPRAAAIEAASTPKPKPRARRGGAAEDDLLHPAPQFARAGWVSLCGAWEFALDREGGWESAAEVEWGGEIEVPFAPETPASGIGAEGYIQGCWYRRRVVTPALGPGERLLLRFGAVDYRATVWVNGAVVAMHEGGYTPFQADITPQARSAEELEIVVRAEDDPHDLAKPRGKQDWQPKPHSIWYPRTTGIWQPVWLERVGRSWMDRLHWTPNVERFEIELWAEVARSEPGLRLAVRLSVGDRLLAEDEYAVVGGEVRRGIAIADPGIDDARNELFWSPDRPVLIRAELELRDGAGAVLDAVSSYAALRSSAVLGDRFMLNGRPLYLRMVLDQGYWPESGLTPPSDGAARRDLELVREMGFNGIRAHQRIPDPRTLYWADVLGVLVWEEMPSPYRYTARSVRRLTREWAEAIERDRSHPSVVVWVPMNESWGVPDLPTNEAHRHAVRAMYHLTRTLDPTRPVVGNDGWEMDITDIVAIHDYDRSPEAIARRYADRHDPLAALRVERPGHRVLLLGETAYSGQPLMLTEFGGIALREAGAWGYSEADSPEDLARRFAALLDAVRGLEVFAGFCYTQFADTYQEVNGLLRPDRTAKVPMGEIRRSVCGH